MGRGLWDIYHRHPWVLAAAAAGPPADPGQLAWLNAGLAALAGTGLTERDKLAAVMAVLHFVRGAAALNIEAAQVEGPDYPVLLRRFVDAERFPALAAALEAGVFDAADDDHLADFHSGLRQLLDGVAAKITRLSHVDRSVAIRLLACGTAPPVEVCRAWRQANRRPSPIRTRLTSQPP